MNGATPAADHVFTSRRWPLQRAILPAWRVFAGDENITKVGLGAEQLHEHLLDINAEGIVLAVDDLDDVMNEMAVAALPAIFAGEVPYDFEQTGVSRREGVVGQADVGVITLHLRAHYFTSPIDPETILSN